MAEDAEWLPVDKVSDKLGVSPSTVRARAKRGELERTGKGRGTRYRLTRTIQETEESEDPEEEYDEEEEGEEDEWEDDRLPPAPMPTSSSDYVIRTLVGPHEKILKLYEAQVHQCYQRIKELENMNNALVNKLAEAKQQMEKKRDDDDEEGKGFWEGMPEEFKMGLMGIIQQGATMLNK